MFFQNPNQILSISTDAQANKIVIPTLTSIVDVQATMATLKDVIEINKNIILVVNRAKNNNAVAGVPTRLRCIVPKGEAGYVFAPE